MKTRMKPNSIVTSASAVIAATAVLSLGQAPPPAAPKSGPGVQAPQDPRQPELLKTCKTPPPARGGARGGGPARGRGPAAPAGPKDYTVTAIPGVIAAG